MWSIRDSDGCETLHSIYPHWAKDAPHLTINEYVQKGSLDAALKELAEVKKELETARTLAQQHMRAMRSRADRLREVEHSLNRYYGLLQQHNIVGLLDDTPIIDVKV